MPSDNVSIPLADAQMLLAWMDQTFGNDSGTDWHDEDAAAVGDALNKAIENFKAMRAACGVAEPPVRCKDCDLPNGCPEYCWCGPQGAGNAEYASWFRIATDGVAPSDGGQQG